MLEEQIKNLPVNPGVYIMYNSEDTVIYVGKAKNLKNRVTQYFREKFLPYRKGARHGFKHCPF